MAEPITSNPPMHWTHRRANLPVEILTIIFCMIIESHHEHFTPGMEAILLEEARTIRAASQVCRLWRDVALSRHKIWAAILDVDSNSTAWIDELFRRSGSATLAIRSTPSKRRIPSQFFGSPKWDAISAHAHRLRKLDIALEYEDINYKLLPFFNQPAPLLEFLALKFSQKTGPHQPFHRNFTDAIYPFLFAGVIPKLHTLTLDNLICLWSLADPMAHNIMRLDLSLSQKDMALFSFKSCTIMHLPNLQELVVTGIERCSRFLFLLRVPSFCMTTLSFTQRDCDSALTNDPVLWVEQYLRGWQGRESPIHSWYLCTSQNEAFAFHAGRKEDPPDRPQFVLEYNGGRTSGLRLLHILEILCGEGILHESINATLDMQVDPYSSAGLAEKLAELLSQCSRLDTLTLLGRSIDKVVPVLTKFPEATAHIRHLIIDGPYPTSTSSLPEIEVLTTQYTRWLRNGGKKLEKISVCVGNSGKYEFLTKGVADFAKVVECISFRPRAVRRGELVPRGCWSLGPCDPVLQKHSSLYHYLSFFIPSNMFSLS
ncbi:hypothetical protein M413DRAFT_27790 [Hebeloma cylindrosporum]|uniref:F-box domain-containing protein n=1 Tax=Hebeloma cylindrosporum TaxID=76867 RepID=A0A0C2XUU7_HEBCY|nr:hypothetical protein M413DRAFT_27790 [Hebeloma cylindrosporum h7]